MNMDTQLEKLRRERSALDTSLQALNSQYGTGFGLTDNSVRSFFFDCLAQVRLYPDAASMYAATGIYSLLGKETREPLTLSDPTKGTLSGMFGHKAKFAHCKHLKAVLQFALSQNFMVGEAQVIGSFVYYVALYGSAAPDGISLEEYRAMAISSAWLADRIFGQCSGIMSQ